MYSCPMCGVGSPTCPHCNALGEFKSLIPRERPTGEAYALMPGLLKKPRLITVRQFVFDDEEEEP